MQNRLACIDRQTMQSAQQTPAIVRLAASVFTKCTKPASPIMLSENQSCSERRNTRGPHNHHVSVSARHGCHSRSAAWHEADVIKCAVDLKRLRKLRSPSGADLAAAEINL